MSTCFTRFFCTSVTVLGATALAACGDGRHFERDADPARSEPGGAGTGAAPGGGATEVAGGRLELGEVWGEGMNVEISGLRWAGDGEIELLLGTVDPDTHAPIEGVDGRNFAFAEDGQDLGAEVLYEVSREQNLRVALVLDLSRSMLASNAVEPLQGAARGLLDALPSGSKVALVQFATGYELVQDFTGDMASLADDIESLSPAEDRTGQFTNLWGALGYAGSLFGDGEDAAGQGRVVVAFTDGRDNVAESDAVAARSALTESGALVYAVGLGAELDRDGLSSLAGESRYAETTRPQALGPIFNDIGRRLGQLVRLKYTTPKVHGQHTLTVTLASADGRRRAGFDIAFGLE